ncbi:hypothetical protein OTU49_007086, partial [Cherax quadricarinatus]
EMLSRIFMRYGSHKAFSIPTVKFRYTNTQMPDPVGNNVDELPRITSPVTKQGNYSNMQSDSIYNDKRWKGRSHDNTRKHMNHRRKHMSEELKKDYTDRRPNPYQAMKATYNNDVHKLERVSKNNAKFSINLLGEIIYGVYPVLLALRAERRTLHCILYKEGSEVKNEKIQEILEIGQKRNIKLLGLNSAQFRSIFKGDQVHQGICCDASCLSYEELQNEMLSQIIKQDKSVNRNIIEEKNLVEDESELTSAKSIEKPFQLWLYLDRIQDPMNFGAVLRSAYFLGVDKVLTTKEDSCRISGVVSKASAGVAEILPVYQVDDPIELFNLLADAGWHLVSSASNGNTSATSASDFKPQGNILLVIGNEGTGVADDLQNKCTTVLTVKPGREVGNDVHCLNVSVATAVILHCLQTKLNLHRN